MHCIGMGKLSISTQFAGPGIVGVLCDVRRKSSTVAIEKVVITLFGHSTTSNIRVTVPELVGL
jgi:hypothetical protein